MSQEAQPLPIAAAQSSDFRKTLTLQQAQLIDRRSNETGDNV
jgi:hypothetical protein